MAVIERVDSTNRWARSIIDHWEQATLPVIALVAIEQSGGRGRGGRGWMSAPGAGLWMTWLGPVDRLRLSTMPTRVGVALCGMVEELGIAGVGLKWPNDVVHIQSSPPVRRKLVGILCQSLNRGEQTVAIIGCGINLDNPGGELARRAVGLRELGLSVAPTAVMRNMVVAVDEAARGADSGWRRAQERYSVHRIGDTLRWHDGDLEVSGEFRGFDSEGRLRLRIGGEVKVLASGEIA